MLVFVEAEHFFGHPSKVVLGLSHDSLVVLFCSIPSIPLVFKSGKVLDRELINLSYL